VCRKNVITSETAGFYGLKNFPLILKELTMRILKERWKCSKEDHFSTTHRVGLCVSLKFPFQGNKTDEFGDLNLSS
jgi:hypothetical protein